MRAAALAVLGVACLATAFGQAQNDVANALADPEAYFSSWTASNGREYAGGEYSQRLGVFKDNLAFIAEHNARNDASFTLGLNEFADLTEEEFIAKHTGFRAEQANEEELSHRSTAFSHANAVPPASVDWREEGAVSKIKNQGSCGSCWAFSATAAIEGINAIKTGEMVEVSVQELVDCDSVDHGCSGGLMDNAFDFIIDNGGIDTWEDYQYLGFPLFCNGAKRKDRPAVVIDGHESVPPGDEAALAKAVSQQPTSVAICVNRNLQFYQGGVYDQFSCLGLNHGVLAAGYGETGDGKKFWLVKNSWGIRWGESGFIRMAKDVDWPEGMNGITLKASYPLKSSPNPTALPEVCDFFGWWECAAPTTCECSFSFFGFFCLKYGCADGSEVSLTAAGEAANASSNRVADIRGVLRDAKVAAEAGLTADVRCADGHHSCPASFPDCDVENARCFNADGTEWVPMNN